MRMQSMVMLGHQGGILAVVEKLVVLGGILAPCCVGIV